MDFPVLKYPIEAVAHYGDQHIEHGHLGHHGCCKKEEECQYCLRMVRIVLRLEHAQCKHILSVDEIKDPEASNFVDKIFILITASI